jgi:hypothetical protein
MHGENKKLISEIVFPSVNVSSYNGSQGSGVIVYSKKTDGCNVETFVLSCLHVVKDCITDSEYDDDIKDTCSISLVELDKNCNIKNYKEFPSDIIAYGSKERSEDWVLIKLHNNEDIIENVSGLLSINDFDNLEIGDDIISCNWALGYTSVISKGSLSNKSIYRGGTNYYLTTAPVASGSSGGGIFVKVKNSYKLIALATSFAINTFDKKQIIDPFINTGNDDKEPNKDEEESKVNESISHICFSIPLTSIYKDLCEINLGYILDK